MAYVIIDLEFNNLSEIDKYIPNYTETYSEEVNGSVKNEIIQIGAIKIDKYMKLIDELKVYIKPSIFSSPNPKILELTGIKTHELENGVSFNEAMEALKAFMGKGDILCSWAKDDVREIIINSLHHNYDCTEILGEYIDIQEYCTKILGNQKVLGLKNALNKLNITVDKEMLHDALNDAHFEYMVFKRLYNSRAVKNYIIKDIYKHPIIKVDIRKEFILDKSRISGNCPKCGNDIKRESDVISQSYKYIYVGECSKCKSKILEEIDIKKNFLGDIFYNKTETVLTEVEYSDYSYKIENVQKKNEGKNMADDLCNHSLTN